jgi:ABC-2 type transport system ATP-binding protein
MAAIEICALEKIYHVGFWRKREKRALHPLTLSVEQGEVFGYLGANGAGKTTTLKLLMRLMFPTGGTARILGQDISEPGVKARVGYLPEQPYFYDYLTASELLHYYAQLSAVPAKDRSRRVDEMLARVGLSDSARMQLRKFSKGMLQRVGIAQAILHDPEVVFLDEPMSGLDPIGRREVRDLIDELKHEGKTIFFSTHILSDAEALCDRVAVLSRGELRGVGAVAELTSAADKRVEIIWQGGMAERSIRALGAQCHTAGDTVRAILAEALLDRAIDVIRKAQGRLIQVTPVRNTLEEYFLTRSKSAESERELAMSAAASNGGER